MTEQLSIVLVRCITLVALSLILPAWIVGAPLVLLSIGSGIAIVRRPSVAPQTIERICSVLASIFQEK